MMMAVGNVNQGVTNVLEDVFHLVMQRRRPFTGCHCLDHGGNQEGCDQFQGSVMLD